MPHRPKRGRPGIDLYRLLAPNNVFQQNIQAMPLDSDQTPGKYAANYMNTNNPAFTPYGTAYEGAQKVVRVTASGASTVRCSFTTAGTPIYLVRAGAPTEKVQLYSKNKEGAFKPAEHNGLQEKMEAVPVPDFTKLLTGSEELTSLGTDKEIIIIQKQLDGRISMWDIFQFQGPVGERWGHWGGYIDDMRVWNGVYPFFWGSAATSLFTAGGVITHQDLVKLARGGKIEHALGFTMPCTGFEPLEPATRQDIKPTGYNVGIVAEFEGKANATFGNPPPDHKGGAESRFYRFPAGAEPGEFAGVSGLLSVGIFRACQECGWYVSDGGPTPPLCKLEWPGTLGSPYSLAAVNPLAGSPILTDAGIGYLPGSLTDKTLQVISEHATINGANALSVQPWQLSETVLPGPFNTHPARS